MLGLRWFLSLLNVDDLLVSGSATLLLLIFLFPTPKLFPDFQDCLSYSQQLGHVRRR
jgi:hypothetical protein